MHYFGIISIQKQRHINEVRFCLVREQKIAPMGASHLQLWLAVLYCCDLSEVNDGCVACNGKFINLVESCIYITCCCPDDLPSCQGKDSLKSTTQIENESRKGTVSAEDGGGRYIVWVHDLLQGQMFHLTGHLSGGQFCQLSSFLPYMQPFVGGVLKAGGKSTEQLCTTIPPLQLLSKTNSPVKLQFTQHCFCLRWHRFFMHRSNPKELLPYLCSRWSLLRFTFSQV